MFDTFSPYTLTIFPPLSKKEKKEQSQNAKRMHDRPPEVKDPPPEAICFMKSLPGQRGSDSILLIQFLSDRASLSGNWLLSRFRQGLSILRGQSALRPAQL